MLVGAECQVEVLEMIVIDGWKSWVTLSVIGYNRADEFTLCLSLDLEF